MTRMLRHKPTGELYVWRPLFAERKDFEEVLDSGEAVVPIEQAPAPAKVTAAKAAESQRLLGKQASKGLPS